MARRRDGVRDIGEDVVPEVRRRREVAVRHDVLDEEPVLSLGGGLQGVLVKVPVGVETLQRPRRVLALIAGLAEVADDPWREVGRGRPTPDVPLLDTVGEVSPHEGPQSTRVEAVVGVVNVRLVVPLRSPEVGLVQDDVHGLASETTV